MNDKKRKAEKPYRLFFSLLITLMKLKSHTFLKLKARSYWSSDILFC